jgi:Cu/Ag efflux protein CusF
MKEHRSMTKNFWSGFTRKAFAASLLAIAAVSGAVAAELADGEIRKIDRENSKLTIKHGPLKSLDMPPMTMVFGVQHAELLEKLQVGDKVRFDAEKVEGRIVVTRIELAR